MNKLPQILIFGLVFLAHTTMYGQRIHFFPPQKDTIVFVDTNGYLYEVLRDSSAIVGNVTIDYLHPEIEMFSVPTGWCAGYPYGNSMLGSRIVSYSDRSYLVFDADSIAIPHIQNVPLLSVFKGDSLTIELVSKTLDTTNQIADTIYNYAIVPIGLTSLGQCLNASALKISKTRGVIAFPGCFKHYLSRSFSFVWPGQLEASKIQRISNQDYGPFPVGTEIHYKKLEYWGYSSYVEEYVNDLILSTQPLSIRRYSYEITNKGPQGITFKYDTLTVNSFFMNHASPQIGEYLSYRIIDSTHSATNFLERIHEDNNGGLPTFILTTTTPMLDTCLLPLIGDGSSDLDQYAKIIGQIAVSHSESVQGYPSGGSRKVLYFNNGSTVWGTPHSISIAELKEKKALQIFPVPSNSFIQINGLPESVESLSWKIFDLNGRMLDNGYLLLSNPEIDIRALNNGVYLLEVDAYHFFRFIKN
jgi:hypothetical protein